jgi:hypothetical protein
MTAPVSNSLYCVANGVTSTNPFIEAFLARDPTANDVNYPIQKRWFNTLTNNEFILVGFTTSQGVKSAIWETITTAGSSLKFPVPAGTSPVLPDGTGNVTLTSSAGTITITGGANSINFDVAGGGVAVDSFAIDAATGPGTNPTLANGAGLVTIQGRIVAAQSIPLRTYAVAANAFFIETQYSSAIAASDATKSGLGHFNSGQFTVDANGFVSLTGGGLAADSVLVDTVTAPGVNPVVPDGAGQISLLGGVGIQTRSVAANVIKIDNISSTPGTQNLGIAYSAGTFTVQGASAALSTSNPAFVTLQSKANPGQLKTITVTANQTFTDGAAGTTDNARFGLTTGVDWSNDIPFFLYAVMDDTETLVNFMISRNPCARVSPASTSISKTGSIINVDQNDFFSLGNITVTSYDSNPCLCIGAFRMTFAGATDSWTVTALTTVDGIGKFMQGMVFTQPSGTNGAASGTFILSNAGTEPQWTTQVLDYSINTDGEVHASFYGHLVNVDGVGASLVQFILPYASNFLSGGNVAYNANIFWYDASANAYYIMIGGVDNGNSYTSTMKADGNSGANTNASYKSNDEFSFEVCYPAYRST